MVLIMILPGCIYKDWICDVFYQGKAVEKPLAHAQQYIRSEHVYDQLTTLGHFDALWISNHVCQAYAQVYACKYMLNDQQYTYLLQQECSKNEHALNFYVLTSLVSRYEFLSSQEGEGNWAIALCLRGTMYKPKIIKKVTLPLEYQLFFGKRFNRFKAVYYISFDISLKEIISQNIQEIRLVFSRIDRKVYLSWSIDKSALEVLYQPVVYQDVLAYDITYPV